MQKKSNKNINNKIPLIIIGSSGHASVIIDVVEKQKIYYLLGLIDPFKKVGEIILKYKILGGEDIILEYHKMFNNLKIFIAIGDNNSRNIVKQKVLDIIPSISFATLIHPSAQIGLNVSIGFGVCIMAGAIINSNVVIKDFVIVNTNSSIDHDCEIQENSSIAPGVVIGGNCIIGKSTSVCIGSIIKNAINIGSNSIIGAGSLLLQDCSDNTIMYGTPAKFIRTRLDDEKYL
jgi:sugar O-acyltransferase (sialic acid O-acetyltransferase NeuD family)